MPDRVLTEAQRQLLLDEGYSAFAPDEWPLNIRLRFIAEQHAATVISKIERQSICELCGCPMPEGEEMFKFHGYSGPCLAGRSLLASNGKEE